MIGKELCPHCGSKQFERQPDSHRQSQDIFYECGNSITFAFGVHGETTSEIDHGGCKNKIEWSNILVAYAEDFDKVAKDTDDRFYGWIEYQFYINYHGIGWKNKYFNRNCTELEFLDEYFQNKELYLAKVVEINNNSIYANQGYSLVTKDYYDWIGPVTLREVNRSATDDVERIIYKVVASEWSDEYINGYVVERNPIGGGDESRNFYDREVLDIIFEEGKNR